MIDAAVNGGAALYKDVFLNPAFISENSSKKAQIVCLKDLFFDQIEACETGKIRFFKIVPLRVNINFVIIIRHESTRKIGPR